MNRLLLTAAVASLALAGCAVNEVEKPLTVQGEEMHFSNLDRTGDGYLTADELPTDHVLFLDFERYDLNGDGSISEHEFGEYIAMLPD
jgi:Ca2+-binding EF-hand superfamily protein